MPDQFPDFSRKYLKAGLFLLLSVFPSARLFSQTGTVNVNSNPAGAVFLYCYGAGCNPTTSSLPSVTNISVPGLTAGIWRIKYTLSGYLDSQIYEQSLPPAGAITFNHTFTAPQPSLTSLSPASGMTGNRNTLTLNGGNFNSITKVRLYDYLQRLVGELSAATQPQDGSWTFTLVDSARITISFAADVPYGTYYFEAVNDTLASSKSAYDMQPNITPDLQLVQTLTPYTDSIGGTHQMSIYRLKDWRSGYPVHFLFISGHTLNGAHAPHPLIVGSPGYTLFPAPPSTDAADITWSAASVPTMDVSLPASSENRQCFNPDCFHHVNYATFSDLAGTIDWALKNGYAAVMPYTRLYAGRDFLSGAYEIISVIEAVKTFPDIDPTRIGMLGGSLGGFLTVYTLSRPDKPLAIKAAVAAVAPIDLRSVETYYFGSLNTLQPIDSLRHASQDFATPYANRMYRSMGRTESSAWDAMSNANTARDLTTPLLLFSGTDDMMVPVSETTNLYNSAKTNGKTVNKYIYQNGPPLFDTKSAAEAGHGVLDTNSPVRMQTVLNENFLFYNIPPDVASIPRSHPQDGDLISILSAYRTEMCAAPAEKANLSDLIVTLANPKFLYASADTRVPAGNGPSAVAAAINYVWALEGVSWTADNVTANLQAGSLPTTCSATTANINSTPTGATISVSYNGGTFVDLAELTPAAYTSVAPGSWRVKLTKAGYQTWEQTQELPPGGAIVFSAVLTQGDTTPPVISGVAGSNISNSAAIIAWTTNEASDSQVEYGPTTAYGNSTALNSAMVTAHSAGLSGLAASTLYHYRVKSRDAASNLATSADYTFTTSAAPDTTAPVISGVISSNISNNAATIAWATNEASNSQVEYGLTTAYGNSTALNSAMVTAHSAGVSGLAASTLYHYRVKSRDAASNLATSADYTFTTSAAPDTTAPVISGVVSSNISNNAATIAWATNEASNSQVEYGPTTAYGNSTALNSAMVTAHSAGLSGLAASTLYHYRVKSRDAASNLGTSADYTFTTSAAPDTTAPVISGVVSSNISNNAATIAWATNEASNSQVEYGLTTAYGNSTALNSAMVTAHSAGLSGLAAGTLYHYRVKSRDAASNLGTSADYTFITTSPAPDTTPPVISGVVSSNISNNAATVVWATNEDSNSQVEYGLTTAYGNSTALNSSMVTAHSAGLSGLAASTLYHYRVKSRDAASNLATSADYTFTTSAAPDTTAPVISGVVSSNISNNAAALAWATNEASDSQVEYGPTTAYGNSTALNSSMVTGHSVGLSGLTAGTLYHYRVKSRDAASNLGTSADYTFTTLSAPDTTAPVISGVVSSNISNNAAVIAWATNEAADSQVEYGPTAAYGNSTALNSSMVTGHSVGLSGLATGTLYHYRVKSRDAAFNPGVSDDRTFVTSAAPDTTPPSVVITAPTAGATVSGYVAISASVSDDIGVAKVEFYVDGIPKSTDYSAPYSYTLDSTPLANGLHIITAKAYDAEDNNAATSESVTVYNLAADTVSPTVSLDYPWNGATMAETTLVMASASDDGGVVKVEFIMAGTTYTDNTAPYLYPLNTLRFMNGPHPMTIKPYDLNNNTAEIVVDLSVYNQTRTDIVMTSTGGAILTSIANITVPPQALAAPVTITVVSEGIDDEALLTERAARAALQNIAPIASGVRLLPLDYAPAGPINIKLPLNHSVKAATTMEEIIGLYSWDDTAGTWRLLISTYNASDDTMNAETAAFSVYRLFSRVPLIRTADVGDVYVFPNPAKRGAKPVFHIEIDAADKVEIRIHDFTGRLIHTKTMESPPTLLSRNNKLTYAYEYEWDAKNAASGAYFYVVIVNRSGGKTIRKGKFAIIR